MGIDCNLFVHRSIPVDRAATALAILAGHKWQNKTVSGRDPFDVVEVPDLRIKFDATDRYEPSGDLYFGRFTPFVWMPYAKFKGRKHYDYYMVKFGSYEESITLCTAFVNAFGGGVDFNDCDLNDCDLFVKPRVWDRGKDKQFHEFENKLRNLVPALKTKEPHA